MASGEQLKLLKSVLVQRLIALAAVACTIALLLAPLPTGWLGIWQGEFLDFGHVPLFAALLIALHFGLGKRLLLALLACVALAAAAEIVQPMVGRTASWIDWVRGTLGAISAAAVIRAFECRSRSARIAYVLAALAALTWPVVDVSPFVRDAIHGYQVFPILADFSTDHEYRRWICLQAALSPTAEGARLDLYPGSEDFSYAALRPVVADFSSYRWLCCEFHVEEKPIDLAFSLRTGMGSRSGTTHAQVIRRYQPGRHLVRFELQQLNHLARPEPLDLADVRYIQLFVYRPRTQYTVVLTRIWLE